MNRMKKIVAICLFMSLFYSAEAQKIRLKVTGQKDTTVYLIKYYGQKLFYADTAEMKNGEVVFEGKKQVPGIVGLLLPGQKYFEFIYNNEDVIMETAAPDFMKNMKVKKSEENRFFVPYVNYITEKKVEVNKLSEERNKQKKDDPAYNTLTDKIESLNKEVDAYQKIGITGKERLRLELNEGVKNYLDHHHGMMFGPS